MSPVEREQACSYQWALMWNNPPWQRLLISEARRRLDLDPALFGATLALNALTLAHALDSWPSAREVQLRYLKQAMDSAWFERLWNPRRP